MSKPDTEIVGRGEDTLNARIYLRGAAACLEQPANYAGDLRDALRWIDRARADIVRMLEEEPECNT